MKITIDRTRCEGYAKCIQASPKVFKLDAKMIALEIDSQTPMGPLLMHMEYAPSGPDGWKISRAKMQMGSGPAQEMPVAQLQQEPVPGAQQAGDRRRANRRGRPPARRSRPRPGLRAAAERPRRRLPPAGWLAARQSRRPRCEQRERRPDVYGC